MTHSVSETFSTYRRNFDPRSPSLHGLKSEDELEQITAEEGLKDFSPAPAKSVLFGDAPRAEAEGQDVKYLWVIALDSLPFALEICVCRSRPERGYLSHTNLTGGKLGYCGGEMWFIDSSAIIINGGSGRYPPRSKNELQEIGLAYKDCGYKVAIMDWDDEAGKSARILRGDPSWL